MTCLLLAGGGHAHVHVLAALARAPMAGADVTLVTPFARQMYSGMLPGWVAGHYAVDQIVIPLPALAAAAKVRLIEGRIVALDAGARRATLADGQVLDYDILSLDTGPVMDRDAIPGAREHALFLRPVEHFVTLFEALLQRAAASALDLAVVGGGAAGVEIALALAWRLQQTATGSRVSLVAGADGPLAGFAAGVRRPVLKALRERRVTLLAQDCSAIEAAYLHSPAARDWPAMCRCWPSAPTPRPGCGAVAWRSMNAASLPPGRPCRAHRTRRFLLSAMWPRAVMRRTPRAVSMRCVPARRWR
jgi:NADH dehydrogenase FAD-containing subunit